MNLRRDFPCFAIISVLIGSLLFARTRATEAQQDKKNQPTPTIEEYQPKSTLVTREHKI